MTRTQAAASAFVAILAAPAVVTAGSQSLSAAERKMRDYVTATVPEQIALVERAVNIGSGTMNAPGVRAVGELFARELKALGFETRWVELPAEMKRGGHLFAEHRARRGSNTAKTVLLLGHLDTVFEGEAQRFQIVDDSTAKGAGTADMKGGDVVIVHALKALNAAGRLADANIIVALMGDEESTGEPDSLSRKELIEAAKRAHAILGFEEDAGKATIARRGFSSWQLSVTAQQAHSSGVFSSGYGAIFETARILDDFRDSLSRWPNLTFNPGIVVGGTTVTFDSAGLTGTTAGKLNIISPTAFTQGDLRFLTPGQLDSARAVMRSIVSRNLAGTSATISFANSNPAMPPTPGNYALLAVLDSVTRDIGQGPTEALEPGLRGASDISYISAYAPAVDGLGVKGRGSHSPGESMDPRSLPAATVRAAVLINRLTHRRR